MFFFIVLAPELVSEILGFFYRLKNVSLNGEIDIII